MKINNINGIESGYIELYRDLKFDIDNNTVTVSKNGSIIVIKDASELPKLFRYLTEFSLDGLAIQIIKYRYGIIDGTGHTFTETARYFNYSDEYIRTKCRQSFRKIKHRLNIDRLFRLWEGEIKVGGKSHR